VNKEKSQALTAVYITTSLGMGGAEEILAKLANGLTELGDRIVIFSLSGDGYHGERLRRRGIEVYSVGAERTNFSSAFIWVVELIRLFFAIKRLRPGLIHSWMYPADIVGGVIGVMLRVPVIWGVFSGSTDRRFYSRRTHNFIKVCARLSHYLPALIISCSSYGRDTHISVGYRESRFLYIPTGFTRSLKENISKLDSKRTTLSVTADTMLVVGMLGRYTVEKDHVALVRAAGSINQTSERVYLVFAGGEGITNHNDEFVKEIEHAGMISSTTLLGQIADKDAFFQAIDVFALISHSEGFPTVIGEAMSHGLPCIVSDAGDAEILVGDQSQIIKMESGSITEKIAERILEFSNNQQLRKEIGLRNRQRIEALFSEKLMIRRYRKAYMHVVKKK